MSDMMAGRSALRDAAVETADARPVNKAGERSLYKARVKIHPKLVQGRYRRLKWLVLALTLAIYYATPWLRWERGPSAPDQAVLLDLPARRFYFFFVEIWPQEIYYLTGLLILAALGLFLATSLFGRVWCGYACPQTVWTDLFVAVERLVEGDRAARIRLDKQPLGWAKAGKRVLKHAIWLVIAMATGGAWVFYFADAPSLARDLATFRAPEIAYLAVATLTFTTYALGGLMREQVCTYMCPWPRIQAAMLDEEALVVRYDRERGEPRAPFRKGAEWSSRGHCIDCSNCVAACPMGIDIRDGLQLECINCGLCADACDEVMGRIDLARGLIRYDTDANAERRKRGEPERIRFVRPRTLFYAGLIVAVGIVMLVAFATRDALEVNVLRDRNPLFVTLSDGAIRNGYTVKILNKAHADGRFAIAFEGLPARELKLIGAADGHDAHVDVAADRLGSFRLFVTVPRAALASAQTPVALLVTDAASGRTVRHATAFVGPDR